MRTVRPVPVFMYVGTGTIKGGGGVIKSSKCLQVGRYRYYYRYKDYYSNKELFYFILLLITRNSRRAK